MQHRDDQPPAFSRPSLLSTEQQEAAARASAQARQAAQAADSAALKAGQAKRSNKGWLAGGAALLVACAGVGAWVALDGGKPADMNVAAARVDTPAVVKVSEPANASGLAGVSAPAGASAAAAAPESEVSAAAILDHGQAPPAALKRESLRDMLNAPATPATSAASATPAATAAPRTAAEELDQLLASSPADAPDLQLKGALEAPSRAPREAKNAAPKDGAKKTVAEAKAVPAKPATGKESAAKAAPVKPAPGDDASLLAALVAHSKQGGAGTASNPGPAPTSLRQCKQLNAAQAEQCRVRLCAGSAKDDPQCKSLRVAKPAAD